MLTSKQRAYLRAMASRYDTIFQIGKGGINENNLNTYLQEVRAGNLYHGTDYGIYNAEAIGI